MSATARTPISPAAGSAPLAAGEAVAVVDIGSNSARVVVYTLDEAGHLRILASARSPLRLARDLDRGGRFSAESMERTLEALRDFRAVAIGAGAARLVAMGTSAVRDALNGIELLDRARSELGLEIQVISGEKEALYGFLGGVRGLPVEHGLCFDLGGGSVQICRFRSRRMVRAWSLPLGALRLSARFLTSDPPRRRELRGLRRHVREALRAAGIPRLAHGEDLVGTGGTVRNLAKMDRRSHSYPIARVHGYLLPRKRVGELAASLARRPLRKREGIAGLSDERADSIAGGALAIAALMDAVKAQRVLVAGLGVREGLAYSLCSEALPAPAEVREASVASLASRFWGWSAEVSQRRTALAGRLLQRLLPRARPELAEALRDAALLLDIGRSVDFFDRHEHAADIVLETDMNGFSHRQIALTSAILRCAGDDGSSLARYQPLLAEEDRLAVERAAVLLALADDIEERCTEKRAVEVGCRIEGRRVVLAIPALVGWRPRGLDLRFRRAFRRALVVQAGGGRGGR